MRSPRIFYFCFSRNKPTGGNKKIYHHVDLLNASGYEAYVLHLTDGFRVSWFQNFTPIVYLREFRQIHDGDRDIIVLPEDLGEDFFKFPGRKVIFNQNLYFGFRKLNYRNFQQPIPYLDASVLGAIVVSDHSRSQLQLAYPTLPIFRVTCSIDERRFQYRTLAEKQPVIVANPSKNEKEIRMAYQILRSRALQGLNPLSNWTWTWIENKSEAAVAQHLSEAQLFLSLSRHEGFGLLPLEAMASGCLVVAYGCEPMTEYLPAAMQVPTGDMAAVVRRVEAWAQNPYPQQALAERGRDVARQYSRDREANSVLAAWAQLLPPAVSWF